MEIHKLIDKLPIPKRVFVLPYHKYIGSYNPLDEQLDENYQPLKENRQKARTIHNMKEEKIRLGHQARQ